jgi:hypothetical protein
MKALSLKAVKGRRLFLSLMMLCLHPADSRLPPTASCVESW